MRHDLTNFEWSVTEPLLPPERGRAGRPAHDNRVMLNGLLWRLRTGAPWRELPQRYGKWNSVYRRYRRWNQAGTWGRVVILLSQMMIRRERERPTLGVRKAHAPVRAAPRRVKKLVPRTAPKARRARPSRNA